MRDELDAEWDLGEILTERKQPTATVEVYLNEYASAAKAGLMRALTTANDADAALIDAQIAELDEKLEETKYTFELTAVPNRMREDIASRALSEFPMKLDYMGRDEVNNQLARIRAENIEVWSFQITDVVNPDGRSKKTWTPKEAGKLQDALTDTAKKAVNEAIEQLQADAQAYSTKSKSVDFS